MNDNKKIMYSIIGIALLLILVVGVTYSFFNYTRTGDENTITVGRMVFRTSETSTISLTNLFPIDPTETGIMNDDTKVGTVTITIEGDTDYNNGLEYLVSIINANVYTNQGNLVPVSLDVTINNLGTESSTYFTARNNKNATIYKRLSEDSVGGNQDFLVGYIKPNTTSGTAEGINGSITIKAYLDKNKIVVSDTFDSTESDNMGTTNEWANGKTVLTTSEWNALESNGISFQIKVEANEGIWVTEPFFDVLQSNAVMDNIASINVSSSNGIDFGKVSGDTDSDSTLDNGEGLYMRSGTENDNYPIIYYRGLVDNNVYFAGKCWQIIRTTDTGGIKLIYNGENNGTENEPLCNNRETSTNVSISISGVSESTFPFAGPNLYNSPAYNGYMYGTVYSVTNEPSVTGAYFGNSFTYANGVYTLTDAQVGIDDYHHYTCNLTSSNGTCSSIRYYYTYFIDGGVDYDLYFTLSDGKSIEDALNEMKENKTDSMTKAMVDRWYEENILNTEFENMIEDTVYCNNRNIYELGGMNPNGGTLIRNISTLLKYSGYMRYIGTINPFTACSKNDSFTVSRNRGNGDLDYPIGLITDDEVVLAGGKMGLRNYSYYLQTVAGFRTMSISDFYHQGHQSNIVVYNNGSLDAHIVSTGFGLRPVISLKYGVYVSSGTGTASSPYIFE